VLYDGELTEAMKAKDDADYVPGGPTPQSAFDEMEAMKQAAIAAREAAES
jgi:hypothetical protein